ncbi:MAG: glycine dehydrogenase, partial [Devosia sp.]|nr:glycine dehydrogenase [Devosia sp.]
MRYLPHSEHERADMLAVIGAKAAEDLFARVPGHALLREPVDLPSHSPEFLVEARMKALAGRNHAAGDGPFFIGAGAYRH